MILAPAPPPSEACQCISTPAAARALLAIILAALHALIEACLTDILARLEDMLTQWRNGTLPPPPPVRPRANRPTTPHMAPTPQPTPESCEPWLARLMALAASDQSAPAPRPRAHKSSTSMDQAPHAPAMPSASQAPRPPRAQTDPIPPRLAPLAFLAWRLGGESFLPPPQPAIRRDRIPKNPAPRRGKRTRILLRNRN